MSATELMPITVYGHPVLHAAAKPVTAFDTALGNLVEAMFASMYAAEGVGLAGPQVAVGLRVFVYDCDGHRGVVANPVLERTSSVLEVEEEGCLSVPGLYYPTPRARSVTVRGQDADGKDVEVEGHGYLARCFQHETDHLDGKLYLERLGGRVHRKAMRGVRGADWYGEHLRHLGPVADSADA